MKIGLGTAQLGQRYGISHRGEAPDASSVAEILARAARAGIRVIDTAPAYGDSEARIGRHAPPAAGFRIVTKTPLHEAGDSALRCAARVRTSVQRSLERLGADTLSGVLEHRPAELLSGRGDAIHRALAELQGQGLVERIGVSCHDAGDALEIARRHRIDLVQLPVNALDRRALDDGGLAALREHGIEIHARSPFLQGALLMRPRQLPKALAPLGAAIAAFQERARRVGRSPLDAALAFVLGLEAVDVVLCGVQSRRELSQILAAAERIGPAAGPGRDSEPIPVAPRWLDPSQWAPTR